MASKKKRGGDADAPGTKSGKAPSKPSPEELEIPMKKQLLQELKTLKAECEDEERLFHEISSEKDQLSHLWVMEQSAAEERHDTLRKKKDEILDEVESFGMELKLCKLRIKQLLAEQSEEATQLRIDAEAALKLREDVHRSREDALWYQKQDQLSMTREMQTAHVEFLHELKLRQDEKILELRREFERHARELHLKWKLRTDNLKDEMQKQRQFLIAKIEAEKNNHLFMVQSQNTKTSQAIKRYYGDITSSNLELIKRLKKEHADLKQAETREGKRMADLIAKNRGLVEPLRKMTQETEKLQNELRLYEIDKAKLAESKQKLTEQAAILARLEQQAEILEQQSEMLKKTKTEFQQRYQRAVYGLQQKACLKTMVLERKLKALEEAEEVAQAQVEELRHRQQIETCDLIPLSKGADRLLKAKDELADELRDDIKTLKDLHDMAVQQYASCMASSGVPVEDLQFVPLTYS
ncbi:putative PF2 arrest specific protein 8/11 [Toxoplasma gondii MAS]|uniref:Putative PF2 arrest specific protein 8/11 n=2 Tax=Toxoplasma gondii TaxID=5811 RepID=A0A086QTR4_TOXGO|nr:putative PF2 arrest specific protein 8/11 [Toxoplasma gondii MAS]PUA90675.1 putative PF2 arrest specific protein 8/11 [Toxoplasma gondii TgCATBr9]